MSAHARLEKCYHETITKSKEQNHNNIIVRKSSTLVLMQDTVNYKHNSDEERLLLNVLVIISIINLCRGVVTRERPCV